jgi:creatinine amidohydrolase
VGKERNEELAENEGSRVQGVRVAEVAWILVAERIAAGAVGVLPVGAASKEHGRHLPMATDWHQAEWLADALVQQANVLVWPTLSYGYYPAFTGYPGSTSLREPTFVTLAAEVLADIQRSGVSSCAVLNTGISTIRPLDAALARVRGFAALRLVNVYSGRRFRAVRSALETQPCGSHADEIETSIMLAVAPEMVDMSRAEPCVSAFTPGPLNRTDPHAPNYSPGGSYGDPTRASAEKGRALVAAMLADTLEALELMAVE